MRLALRGGFTRFQRRLVVIRRFIFQHGPDNHGAQHIENRQHGEQRAKADSVRQRANHQGKHRARQPGGHTGHAVRRRHFVTPKHVGREGN